MTHPLMVRRRRRRRRRRGGAGQPSPGCWLAWVGGGGVELHSLRLQRLQALGQQAQAVTGHGCGVGAAGGRGGGEGPPGCCWPAGGLRKRGNGACSGGEPAFEPAATRLCCVCGLRRHLAGVTNPAPSAGLPLSMCSGRLPERCKQRGGGGASSQLPPPPACLFGDDCRCAAAAAACCIFLLRGLFAFEARGS